MKLSTKIFRFEFVKHIPKPVEEGIVYISTEFATAIHLCACGCGKEVVTKISPNRWRLIFEGDNISLDPSIGNFSLPCRSHYWILHNKVIVAKDWSMGNLRSNRRTSRSGSSKKKGD